MKHLKKFQLFDYVSEGVAKISAKRKPNPKYDNKYVIYKRKTYFAESPLFDENVNMWTYNLYPDHENGNIYYDVYEDNLRSK